MSVSVQPSFAPDEFVIRWLSRTKSPPPMHEHEKNHDDMGEFSPVPHKHAARIKSEAGRRNIPHSPSEKGARAHRSEDHHEHHQKSTQRISVPHNSFPSHTNRDEFEEKDFKHHHRRKRPSSSNAASETDGKCRRRKFLRRPSSGVRSEISSRVEISDRKGGPNFPTSCVPAVGENSEKRYEKRPRHKTRPDKYEVKVDKRVAGEKVHELAHKISKRRRRKKSGLAFNHDFKAPNVLQERLTLKPNDGPGIFHRGRASAPVERRGLPDLTFSEMDFLTKRRHVDDARHRRSKDVPSSTKKSNRGSAQEVSTFFPKPEDHDKVLQDLATHVPGQREGPVEQSISPNKSLPRMTGNRKALSMISGNEVHAKTFSTNGLGPTPLSQCWAPDLHMPTVKHDYPAQKWSPLPHKRDNSATSYPSWSATPSEKGVRRPDLRDFPKAPWSVARTPSDLPLLPRSRKRDIVEVATRPPDRSSISNRSLEQYTKHVLLQKNIQSDFVRDPGAAGRGGYCTLQDLQRLSRLSELGRANGESAIRIDQPCDSEGQARVDIPLTDLDEHKHALLADRSSREVARAPTARSMAPISSKPINQPRREGFVGESTADSAATGARVARSGRQDARPPDHLPLRDSRVVDSLRFSPDRLVWLPSPKSPYAGLIHQNPVSRNAEWVRNSLHGRLSQTHDFIHQLSRHEYPVTPIVGVGYPEPCLTTQVHSREPTVHAEPVTGPEPFHVSQVDIPSAEYRTMDEDHDKAYESAYGDGQDDFDRALLQEPWSKSTRDPSLNVLDQFGRTGTSYSFSDPGTALPHIEEDVELGDGELRIVTPGNNTSNFNAGVALQEENVIADRVSRVGLERNRTSELNLVLGNGFQEEGEHFMGFSRPHILY